MRGLVRDLAVMTVSIFGCVLLTAVLLALPVLRRARSLITRRLVSDSAVIAVSIFVCILQTAALLAPVVALAADVVPRDALRYRGTLEREAQRVWGLQPPVATLAGQVHQESHWNPAARSAVGAAGLAQFMPATSQWLGGLYGDLADQAPANPTWALRALVTYDRWLYERIRADNECERMAFALSAYNGGLGWVYKRQKRSAQPGICFGATCGINPGIALASQRENEGYPDLVLHRYEPLYRDWGNGSCP